MALVKRVGEKFHDHALALSDTIGAGHEGVCSAIVLTEVPGALASSTTMPVEKIYETEASVLAGFRANVRPFEQYADDAVDLMLEFRELKRRFDINSADFVHLATAKGEGCGLFVTVDEKHLLRQECRKELSSYIYLCNPAEATKKVSG